MSKVVAIAFIFIWCGLIIGISFMEAPLKFTAPNITLELGLGIGKIVFSTLNKMELVLALGIITSITVGKFAFKKLWFLSIPFGILAIQTFWLLPVLDNRADLIISGTEVPDSNIHLVYIVLEILKLLSLLGIGFVFGKKWMI